MAKKGIKPAPTRDVPNPMLLALVAQYLANNGFSSAHRIFNTERKRRPKKEGWQGSFAKSYTARLPPLETIFQTWKEDHSKDTSNVGTSDSEASDPTNSDVSSTDTSDSTDGEDSSEQENAKVIDTKSASESSSDGDSDDEEEDEEDVQPPAAVQNPLVAEAIPPKSLKRKAYRSSSDSSSSESDEGSSSDSDSAVEGGKQQRPAKRQRKEARSSSSESEGSTSSDSDSDSASSSSSDSSADANTPTKTLKAAAKTKLPESDSSSSSDDSTDSDSSSSDSEVATDVDAQVLEKASSDSSGTIVGDSNTTRSVPMPNSGGDVVQVKEVTITKKKHTGARPSKLAALSETANLDEFVSNTYVAYDYADKAYRDLSITRGKGFTKEKNKKKRGSYRGGTIDIGGGKGFKFDD